MEEKNKTIEKKTGAALHATQEKNRISNELGDLRDQIDIKDRKVNVLQRKVLNATFSYQNRINFGFATSQNVLHFFT